MERDELRDAIATVRTESSDLKLYMQQVESRHNAAERVVAALRDALRDERNARSRAEADTIAAAKVNHRGWQFTCIRQAGVSYKITLYRADAGIPLLKEC